jgi:D-alanyl-D-alanine carboxypeptidase
MRTISILLLLLLVAACRKGDIGPTEACRYDPDPQHAAHPRAARYQEALDTYVAKGLPGIALHIRDRDGVWVGSAGMADIGKGVPFRPCTVSKVASITKMMVGTLTMQLVEEGLLGLDDIINPWLPEEVLKAVRNARGATVRQLMQHTTGIYDIISDNGFYLGVLNNPDKAWTAEDLIRYAYGKSAEFPLGSSCLYSNTNTLLLSMVLDRVLGRHHALELKERILQPLGLENTFYYHHQALPPYTAQGYYDLYNNGTIANVTNFNTGSGNGYGGMFSNVFDMATFLQALVVDRTLLSEESLEEMMRFIPEEDPDDPANDLYLGAGLMQRWFNQPLGSPDYGIGHTGRDLAYSANSFYFPDHQTLCCFLVNYGTNGESGLKKVFFEFQDAVTDIIVGK